MIAAPSRLDFADVQLEQRVNALLMAGHRLPRWGWPMLRPYNGATGEERIRAWQKWRVAELQGWIEPERGCSICGSPGPLQRHNENYFRPFTAKPICRSCHCKVHLRFTRPDRWRAFAAQHRGAGWHADLLLRQLTRSEAMALADRENPLSSQSKPAGAAPP